MLVAGPAEIDGAGIDPGRCAGFEPAQPKTELGKRGRQADGGLFAGSPPFGNGFAGDDASAQKGAGG